MADVERTNKVLLKMSDDMDNGKHGDKMTWITDARYHEGKSSVWVNYEEAQKWYRREIGNPQARLDQLFKSRGFECTFVDEKGNERVYHHDKYRQGQKELDPELKTINIANAEKNVTPRPINLTAPFSPNLRIAPYQPDGASAPASTSGGLPIGSFVPPPNAQAKSVTPMNPPHKPIVDKLDGIRGVVDETNAVSLQTNEDVTGLKDDVTAVRNTLDADRVTLTQVSADVTVVKNTVDGERQTVRAVAADVAGIKTTAEEGKANGDLMAVDIKSIRKFCGWICAALIAIILLLIVIAFGVAVMYFQNQEEFTKAANHRENVDNWRTDISRKLEACQNLTTASDNMFVKLEEFRKELEQDKVAEVSKPIYVRAFQAFKEELWKLPIRFVSYTVFLSCLWGVAWCFFWI